MSNLSSRIPFKVRNFADVSASRVLDVIYQNLTGHFIVVLLELNCGVTNLGTDLVGASGADIQMEDVTPPTLFVGEIVNNVALQVLPNGNHAITQSGNITFIVPPGWYYEALDVSAGQGASPNIDAWWEGELI
jgi:hypothetical protein